ncbi:MAG: hypothetical protein LBU77_07490, partial [Clostridiales bacterium]|nr:hypothetical protein [Clostridiales bacterium]
MLVEVLKRKNTVRLLLCATVLAAFCTVAVVLLIVKPFSTEGVAAQSSFSLDYSVAVRDPEVKILEVSTVMAISRLSEDQMIYLYRANVDS